MKISKVQIILRKVSLSSLKFLVHNVSILAKSHSKKRKIILPRKAKLFCCMSDYGWFSF